MVNSYKLRAFLSQFLIKLWYSKPNFISYFLLPFSYIFQLIVFLRYHLYKCHILKVQHFPVPIIVVGNISVGGTGKTPLVIALARILKHQGFRPGIISRGYGVDVIKQPLLVTENSAYLIVGEEAILIAKHTACPVIVAASRVNAAKQLLENHSCNVIISDDGLQHYALHRDIEIAVIDGQRLFGNGFCLPAGPLREPVSRLHRVNYKVINGLASATEFTMQLVPTVFHQLIMPDRQANAHDFADKTIHALAGIGNPQRFFTTLRGLGLDFVAHEFPDHHVFSKKDIDFENNSLVIMTEKDAIKCSNFADQRHWYLAITPQVPEDLVEQLIMQLKRLGAKESE